MPLVEQGSAELAGGLVAVADGLDDLAPDETIVVARARRLAPVATGRLASSIVGTTVGTTATIGTPVPYGLPVHFGVPSHGQRAQPFLHQAVDAEQVRIVADYTRDVEQLLERNV